ncbi:MAG: hypothetical protein PHY16_15735 [Methylobacter sp.]|nr:hypothetical protein [Methylobacter sp.]
MKACRLTYGGRSNGTVVTEQNKRSTWSGYNFMQMNVDHAQMAILGGFFNESVSFDLRFTKLE